MRDPRLLLCTTWGPCLQITLHLLLPENVICLSGGRKCSKIDEIGRRQRFEGMTESVEEMLHVCVGGKRWSGVWESVPPADQRLNDLRDPLSLSRHRLHHLLQDSRYAPCDYVAFANESSSFDQETEWRG